jgi:hypothetical protein
VTTAVCDSSSSRFVENPEDVEIGDSPSIFSGLLLGVVEVGGNGDDGVGNGTSKMGPCSLLHLKDH